MAESKKEEVVVEVPKTVTIRIPRTSADQEDVVVWVNDRRFLIKRGVPVEVELCVAEILEEQEKMLEYSYKFNESKTRSN